MGSSDPGSHPCHGIVLHDQTGVLPVHAFRIPLQGYDRQSVQEEGREETRSDLQTYRIDEEYQTEVFGERLHERVERHAEMTARDRAEEYPRDAEGDPLELQFGAQEDTYGDREGQD